jgi:hypothetical protein
MTVAPALSVRRISCASPPALILFSWLLSRPTPLESPAPGDYCRPEQIAAVIQGLERTRTDLLLLRPFMYTPRLLMSEADHLQPFHDYLFAHYRRTKIFATGDEVWRRIGR